MAPSLDLRTLCSAGLVTYCQCRGQSSHESASDYHVRLGYRVQVQLLNSRTIRNESAGDYWCCFPVISRDRWYGLAIRTIFPCPPVLRRDRYCCVFGWLRGSLAAPFRLLHMIRRSFGLLRRGLTALVQGFLVIRLL